MQALAAACALLPALAAVAAGCATVRGLSALRDVEFVPERVTGIRLAGMPVGDVASAEDIPLGLAAMVAAGVLAGSVPLECTVIVRATNPATNPVRAELLRLNWMLLVDGKGLVDGAVTRRYSLAPGQPVEVPVHVAANLADIVGRHAGTLLRIAVALAEGRAGPVDLAVRVAPVVDTPLGGMRVPAFTIPLDSLGR